LTGAVVGLVLIGAAALSAADSSPTSPRPQFLSLNVGGTTAVSGEAGSYERVLLMPPDESGLSLESAWEISAEVAIKLGRLAGEPRWRAIRRNLGLGRQSLIMWTEVDDVLLDTIAKLPLAGEAAPAAFGLRVAFPGPETTDAKPDVALTLDREVRPAKGERAGREKPPTAGPPTESDLRSGIATTMTGVEGFVTMAPGSEAALADVLEAIEIRLTGEGGDTRVTSPDAHGYFCFPHLPVDPDFGSDYDLHVASKPEPAGSEESGEGGVGVTPLDLPEVPVKAGARTRVVLTVAQLEPTVPKGISIQGVRAAFGVEGAALSSMITSFVGQNYLLGAVLQRLPENPGLHLGAVGVRGAGLQPLWSTRYYLQPPKLDRRPQFVSRGTMRLECWTAAATAELPERRYLKVVWLARATEADLDLRSRRVTQTPWGISVGVVPSVSPALYSVGASYKLKSSLELIAGVGIQQNNPTSLLYGVAIDVDRILDAVVGTVKR